MIEFLLAPETATFAAAIALVLALAVAEAVGLVFGAAPSSVVDQALPDLGAEADGPEPGGLLSWLGIGRAPLLVVMILFLTAFGLSGFALQTLARAAFGGALPLLAAVPAALIAATPMTGFFTRLLPRGLQSGETEAVSAESFVGRVATILRGEARQGMPAEARVKDAFGKTHYVRIEPDLETETLEQGAEALIVSRRGPVYRAIRNANAALSPAPKP